MPASSFWNVWSKNFQSADQFLSRLGPFVSKNQHFERWWEISTRMRMVSTQRTDLKFQWLVPVQQWIAENNHWPLWVDFYDFDFLWSYFDLRLSLGSSKGMPPAPLPSLPTHEKNVISQKKSDFFDFFLVRVGCVGGGDKQQEARYALEIQNPHQSGFAIERFWCSGILNLSILL